MRLVTASLVLILAACSGSSTPDPANPDPAPVSPNETPANAPSEPAPPAASDGPDQSTVRGAIEIMAAAGASRELAELIKIIPPSMVEDVSEELQSEADKLWLMVDVSSACLLKSLDDGTEVINSPDKEYKGVAYELVATLSYVCTKGDKERAMVADLVKLDGKWFIADLD